MSDHEDEREKTPGLDAPDFALRTERLLIRRFRADDWRDLYTYLSDPEVVKFEPYEPFTEAQSQQEAIRRSTDRDFFAVERIADGKVIGNLYFSPRDFGAMELGYVFLRAAWHCGYAAEAAHALMALTFETTDCPRIIAECDPANPGSWKLLERLGMRRERRSIRDHYFKCDDNGSPLWSDSYGYAILREEFSPRRQGADWELTPFAAADVPLVGPIMKRAFDHDLMLHLGRTGGPPGYDDGSFLRKWALAENATSFRISIHGQVAGAVVLWLNCSPGVNVLGCLFLAPEYQHRGWGLNVWREIEKRYPARNEWRVETPGFSRVNHHFYVNKCGFQIYRIENPKSLEDAMYHLHKPALSSGGGIVK